VVNFEKAACLRARLSKFSELRSRDREKV
jgi:hypothetical protein